MPNTKPHSNTPNTVHIPTRERIGRIVRLTTLLFAKELWGLACHLYGLVFWPFATIRKLWITKDKSQLGLLGIFSATPVLVTTGLLLGLVLVQTLTGWELRKSWLVSKGLWFVGFGFLLTIVFWIIWWLKMVRKER